MVSIRPILFFAWYNKEMRLLILIVIIGINFRAHSESFLDIYNKDKSLRKRAEYVDRVTPPIVEKKGSLTSDEDLKAYIESVRGKGVAREASDAPQGINDERIKSYIEEARKRAQDKLEAP